MCRPLATYARSELLERHQGTPVYFHSARCPSFCDFACNGRRGARIADAIERREASRIAAGKRAARAPSAARREVTR